MNVDAIFIINLKHREDRLRRCEEIMTNEGLTWERFDAIKYDPSIHGYEQEFNKFRQGKGGKNIAGAFGCLLSHYKIMELAKSRGCKSILVMEDDFEFVNGWRENYTRCMKDLERVEWNMFYLSLNMDPVKKTSVTDNIFRPYFGLAASAYIVRESMYDEILTHVFEYAKEIDLFYATYLQGKRDDIYAPHKIMVYQRPSYSDIEGKVVDYSHLK